MSLPPADDPPAGETREMRAIRWAAEHRRRAALVADCNTWQERALRLYAAGETSRGLIDALGLQPDPQHDRTR